MQRRSVGTEDDVENGEETTQDDCETATGCTEEDVLFAARIAIVGVVVVGARAARSCEL